MHVHLHRGIYVYTYVLTYINMCIYIYVWVCSASIYVRSHHDRLRCMPYNSVLGTGGPGQVRLSLHRATVQCGSLRFVVHVRDIVYMHACMHACMYVRMYVCMYVCIPVCMYVRTHACMYACMYVYQYVDVCSVHLYH